jgi:hypothetical protein
MSTSERRGPNDSRGIAITNWFMMKATGLLEKKASRRGFLIGSALAGSAVAVVGVDFATRPGSAYAQITGCPPGSLCTDGYTEFCCAINPGSNTCPPGTFAGGWWRADNSSFCGGSTRYYVDCMQNCCGPLTGYQNFCAGCTPCECANGCDTRRIYCNYFRYGQCHQEIVQSGPIACRVVSCVPPYTVSDMACSSAAAVDNATAEHAGNCLPVVPPSLPAEEDEVNHYIEKKSDPSLGIWITNGIVKRHVLPDEYKFAKFIGTNVVPLPLTDEWWDSIPTQT